MAAGRKKNKGKRKTTRDHKYAIDHGHARAATTGVGCGGCILLPLIVGLIIVLAAILT